MVQMQEWLNPHLLPRRLIDICRIRTAAAKRWPMPDQLLSSLARRWILEAILQIFDAELADSCYGLSDVAGAPVSLPPRLSPVARSDRSN